MAGAVKTVNLDQFEKKFFHHMNQLRQENLFCDVRFNVNGTIVPCHRLVLATVSPYFKTMFNGNFKESHSDTISMNDIETETFEEILNAMYTGSICLHPRNAYFILKACHLLQLEVMEKACVSYIMKYPKINYLVDACVFARNIHRDELYSKCVATISNDFVDYGNTDSFKKIPVDVFERILCQSEFCEIEEESVILAIMKWAKENNASRQDVQILLDAANLKTSKYVSTLVMSELFVTYDKKCINDAGSELTISQDFDCSNTVLPLALYSNAIDVETGQLGWSVLKTNASFDKYVLSSFYPTDSFRKGVCRVGTKLYCFEYFESMEERNVFSYYNEDCSVKISLTSPEVLITEFEMAAVGTSIYLMEKRPSFSVWLFNCELNTWRNIIKKNKLESVFYKVSASAFSDGIFYVIARTINSAGRALFDSQNYLFSINCRTLDVKELTKIPLSSYEHSSICVFDGRIAVFGASHFRSVAKMFMIFDLGGYHWSTGLKEMNGSHMHSRLFHHNGSVYVVETGRTMVPNEKYDLISDKWTDLPHLPKKIAITNTNDVLAIREVFGVEVNP
ncbi:kelch-like protein 28 [Planococcus citri]|uniref:kelch-like protein 28 n=1 Tax=Planococcus citri TaxID=170843 RepID=UPI0031F79A8F